MSEAVAETGLAPGQEVVCGLIMIDLAGATGDWGVLGSEATLRRRARYQAGVDDIAREASAHTPLQWQGDGTTLFLPEGDPRPSLRAALAAEALWQRVRIDLGQDVRVAVHAAPLRWNPDTGRIADPALDRLGHLLKDAPRNAILMTEDTWLDLPALVQERFVALGSSVRDGVLVYVFPGAAAGGVPGFADSAALRLWQRFRKYAASPEIRKLRYVGFRLRRPDPPSLDIEDVFVAPRLGVVRPAHADALPRPLVSKEAEELMQQWRAAELAASAPASPAELVRRHRHLVVLGDPGAGKSTLVRWLAGVAAGGPIRARRELGISERLLPLPVSVGRLAELRASMGDASVLDVLARYYHERSVGEAEDLKAFLEERLDEGQGLVLLDGLDEVRTEARSVVHAWLEAFAARYPRNRFVVTSRRVGFGGFDLPDGPTATLAPFSAEQVDRYMDVFTRAYARWEDPHGAETRAPEEARRLRDALRANPRLSEIARSPFLLSCVALIHRAEGRLPQHRVLVYETVSRTLCETWDAARRLVAGSAPVPMDYAEEALPVLGRLALRMHEEFPTGVAPDEFVRGTLAEVFVERNGIALEEARRVADAFVDRAARSVQILVERGAGAWGFLHLTFQEFFAAAGLHADDRFETFLKIRLFEPRWLEVLRLGVGYMALVQHRTTAVRKLIEQVLTKPPRRGKARWKVDVLRKHVPVAALLAVEAGDVLPEDAQKQVADALVEWFALMPAEIVKPIASQLGDGGIGTQVAHAIDARLAGVEDEEQAKHWLAALGAIGTDVTEEILCRRLSDPAGKFRESIPELLAARPSEWVLEALGQALRGDLNAAARAKCAEALGKNGDETAVASLLDVLTDPQDEVRRAAIVALTNLSRRIGAPSLADLEARRSDPIERWLIHLTCVATATFEEKRTILTGSDNQLKQLVLLTMDAAKERDSSIVTALHGLLNDGDTILRNMAASQLATVGDETAIEILRTLLRSQNKMDQLWGLWPLLAVGDELAVAAFQNFLGLTTPEGRAGLIKVMAEVEPRFVLGLLRQFLSDKYPIVRSAAAGALADRADPSAIPDLLPLLSDPVDKVRAAAACALGHLSATSALNSILPLAEDPSSAVHSAALEALWRLSEAGS